MYLLYKGRHERRYWSCWRRLYGGFSEDFIRRLYLRRSFAAAGGLQLSAVGAQPVVGSAVWTNNMNDAVPCGASCVASNIKQ